MAIINSVGVGNGSKSVGEFTYRNVRGRTVASKRVLKNSSNSAAQGNQRSLFASLSKFLTAYDCYVFNAFSKTRYGSRRNRAAKELKSLSAFVRSVYETLTASGVPLNLVWNWFARAMSAARAAADDGGADAAAIRSTLLQSSDIGVSVSGVSFSANLIGDNRSGYLVNFAVDKCGTELLEIIRAKRPAWAALSDAEVLRRAFSVASYAIATNGRGVSLGEVLAVDAPVSDDITPIGSYVTTDFNLLLNVPVTNDEVDDFGLNGVVNYGDRVYVFNILKFLGQPVNLTFDVAFNTVADTDTAIYPIEP